MTVTAVS